MGCGYIRESTKAQGEKFGPDAQRQAIRRAAHDLGIALDEPRWYVDLITGTGRVVRDELRSAMRDACAGEYDVLICYDTSRWARNERDAFGFEADMHAAGARIYYVSERVWSDDGSEGAAISKGVMHVLNAQFSRTLSRKIRDGLRAKRAKGGYAGGVPWGYRYSADRMALEPTDEHPVRMSIWERFATGRFTYATLAAALNGDGRSIRGRPFTKFTLHEILRRDVDVRLGYLPRDVYDRAQAIRVARTGRMLGKRRHHYLLADMARCDDCGERMIGRAFWRPGAREPVLQVKHPYRGCKHGIRNEAVLRERIGDWLDGWRLPSDVRTRIARYLRNKAGADPNATRRRRLQAAVERLRKQHQWGALSDQDFLDEHARLAAELADAAPRAVVPPPSTASLKLAETIGKAWRVVSDERRKDFLTEWFTEVRIASDGTLTMVPRNAYAPIVYAAVSNEVVPVGCAGLEPAGHTSPACIVLTLDVSTLAARDRWLAWAASA